MRRLLLLCLTLGLTTATCSSPTTPTEPPRPARDQPPPPPDSPPPPAPTPPAPSSPPAPAPLVRPLPSGGHAQAATIRLVNRTGDPIELDTTDGGLAFLAAGTPNGDLGPLLLDDEADVCDCICGHECPSCEPPRRSSITVPARGTRELPWNGRLRRAEANGRHPCQRVFEPEAGPLVVGGCTSDGQHCAAAEVTLPAAAPIELAFSAPPRAASCPLPDRLAERAYRIAAFTMDGGAVVPDRRTSCRMEAARCVMPEAVELARDGVRRRPCSTFLIPRREGIEVETFLPLPAGTNGGESFSVFLDPNTLRLTRARYEQ